MHITETQHSDEYILVELQNDIDYDTNLKFGKYSAFGQVSKSFLDQKLSLSFGLRTDANSYSSCNVKSF